MRLLAIHKELYRRGDFEFIYHPREDKPAHDKQRAALEVLTVKGNGMREVFYGGAAGGGKSWLGCAWLTFQALTYPGTRWFVARNQLNDLRDSTQVTFGKVFAAYDLQRTDVTFNANDNYYKFSNGSVIKFLQIKYSPSDPMFEGLGSKEYTGGWIEEAGEIHPMGYQVIKSRIGRHLNEEYDLPPVLLVTANPKQNWMYRTYYQPYKNKTMPEGMTYILSLVDDNPHISEDYKKNLDSIKDKVTKQRLRYGNWEYDNNPNRLVDREALEGLFNNPAADRSGYTYITADIARHGSDNAVIWVWQGHTAIDHETIPWCDLDVLEGIIIAKMAKYTVPRFRVLVDEDGVGGGVKDHLKVQGFLNGSSPIGKENYSNLKTQCAYKLADDINAGIYGVDCYLSEAEKEMLVEELEQMLQNAEPDRERKLTIPDKKQIKENIGRSPDKGDSFTMRRWFDLHRVQNDRGHAIRQDRPV